MYFCCKDFAFLPFFLLQITKLLFSKSFHPRYSYMETTPKWEHTNQKPMMKLVKCSTDSNVEIKVSSISVQNKSCCDFNDFKFYNKFTDI